MDQSFRRSPGEAVPKAAGAALTPRRRAALIVAGIIAAALAGLFLFLAQTNWNWLRGPVARFVSIRIGRPVELDGNLTAHLLTLTPEIDAGGLRIGNPAWAGPGDVVQVDQLKLRVRLPPLLALRLELPLVELQSPRLNLIRDLKGRENWALDPSGQGQPLHAPPIQRFLIEQGRLHLVDAERKIVFDGAVSASETPQSSGGRGFALTGLGRLNTEPYALTASGGPLIDVRRDRPYPFHMDVRSGPSHAVIDGSIRRPFDLGVMDGSATMDGPDLSRLYELTGVPLPNTKPYRLAAHFDRRGSLIRFTGLHGVVGSSDLTGQLSVDRIKGRRTLIADLSSQRLYFPDVAAAMGGAPTGAAAAPAPAAQAKPSLVLAQPKGGSDRRIFPDAPLLTDRLRSMDAQVRYRAAAIRNGAFGVSRGAVDLTLDRGVLTLDPIHLDFAQGRVGGRIRLDASGSPVKTDLDMRVTDFLLQQFLRQTGPDPAIQGMLEARAKLHGEGNSVRKAAASANGEVVFVVPHGQMRQAFAELLGINVGSGLIKLLSKDPKRTDIRCGVAQFDVKNGLMQAQTMVIDTGVVTTIGSGTIDLRAESIHLDLKGKSKHPELLRVWAPIQIRGTLSKPVLGVSAGAVAGQTGLGAAIAAALGPLTVVLPFLSPGAAKDADCVGLVTDAKAFGAPVKVSQTTPPAPPKH